MSLSEIIEELPHLTADERRQVIDCALALDGGWLDSDAPLSVQEKALIEERLLDAAKNPDDSIPWEEAKARLLGKISR